MAKRQFEIQGSTLRIGGVDLEAGTTGVVIPGITQATNYRVEDIEDTDDQTQTFSGTVTVIDKVTYDDYVANGSSTGRATFNVDLKGNGKIDEIEVDNEGTYTAAESTTNKNNDLYAYTGSAGDPFSPFVSGDWSTIPFRPKMRPKDVETVGGPGGGAESLEDLSDISLNNVQDGQALIWNDSEEKWENQDINVGSSSSIEYGGSQVNIPTSDGPVLISVNEENSWQFQSGGQLLFPDGSIQTTAYTGGGGGSSGQQYGYINQYIHSTNNDVDMEAVVMDSLGNSYVSYAYYDNDVGIQRGGIIKLDSTGATVWCVNLQSENTNAEYPRISSLEYATYDGSDYIVAIGDYYDSSQNRTFGFMWFVSPSDGSTSSMFHTETTSVQGVRVKDAVFGDDGSGGAFAVIVGESYNEVIQKSFTPLAGTGVNKLVVSWAEFSASGLEKGEYFYYTVGGNYQFRMNGFDVTASLDGTGNGLYLTVATNQDGTYSILRYNGASGDIYSWTDPVNVRVLGSNLGGVNVTNDLTFDFSLSALNNNSSNVAGWASNIQGTAVSDVICLSGSGLDLTSEIGNTLTFDYLLQQQAYIARLGSNSYSKSLGTSDYERLDTVAVDSNGNAYAGGYYWLNNKGSFVVKYNASGVEQWAVHIDPSNNTGNTVMSIDLLSDGNVIAVDEDGCVTKLNSSNGSIIWQVRVDPNNDISWNSDFRGTATPDGNYIFTNYEDNNYSLYVLCVSGTDGSEIWSKRISRYFAGTNGEIYPQDNFDAQYIDCNATSVTIAGSTQLYFNGNNTYAGLIINFPISGENTDGQYEQYIIESATPGWSTETTTSTSVTVNTISSPVSTAPASPSTSTNSFTATETLIGTAGISLGNFEFDGDIMTINADGSEDMTIRAIDDLYLEAQGDDIHLRAEDDIRLYTGYNFTDGSYSYLYRFNSGGDVEFSSNNDGTFGRINTQLDGSNRVLVFGGESESWITSNFTNYTWKFDVNGVTQIPGTIQGSNGVNISIDSNFTSANQLFRFRGGDVASHLHFDTSNSSLYDLYVGDDNQYVKVSKDGTIDIGTRNNLSSTDYRWEFDTDGQLNVPGPVAGALIPAVGNRLSGIRPPDGYGGGGVVYTTPSTGLEFLGDLTGYVVTRDSDNVTTTIVQMRNDLGGSPGFEVADATIYNLPDQTFTYTSPGYVAPQPTDLILQAATNQVRLTTAGHIDHAGKAITFKPSDATVGAGVSGTVWDSNYDVQAVKFVVHGVEATTGKSQSCEVLITKDANDDLAISVYAIVYTSTEPLYTLDAAYDSGTGVTRLDATVAGANNVNFTVHVTAIYYD
jgi:hypothetical protein